jgi:tetratricopeptide (TPR) repeat protein
MSLAGRFAIGALLAMVSASPGLSATAQEWKSCLDGETEHPLPGVAGKPAPQIIAGCTAVLNSGASSQDLTRVLLIRGWNHLTINLFDDAIKDFDLALQFNPNSVKALARRCFAHQQKYRVSQHGDDMLRAMADCSTATAKGSPNIEALTFEGDLHLLRGEESGDLDDYEEAKKNYDAAIELSDYWARPFLQRAAAWMLIQNYGLAIENYDLAISINASTPAPPTRDYSEAFVLRGIAYHQNGDDDSAIEIYKAAIKIDPKNGRAYSSLGALYLDKGDYDTAIENCDKAILLDRSDAIAYYLRGTAYEKKGDKDRAKASYYEAVRVLINPQFNFSIPTNSPSISTRGVHLARPPLPDETRLKQCKTQSTDSRQFMNCLVDRAMPKEYRITSQCVQNNPSDYGRAFVCSTDNRQLLGAYDKFKQINDCVNKTGSKDASNIARCSGDSSLGDNERYYLSCVTENKGDLKTAAVCALIKDLTPEQQIAISCAISSGGQPQLFAACAGGQLLARELDKCWTNGVATDGGCFGPNNEFRNILRRRAALIRQMFGEDSAVYKAYMLWQDNVLAPGANHEVVKFLNNGLHDVKSGLGPNNEYVKATNAVSGVIQGVGKALDF